MPCITHMCVFRSIVYAIVMDEKRDKLDVKIIKFVFLGYCKGMKAYRLMYLERNKIIKNKNVLFMEDSGSIRNDLEMCPSERNEGPMVVVVEESSKSPLFDGGGQFVDDNEEVEGNGLAVEEACEGPVNDDVIVEGFGGEWRSFGEWW